MKRYVYLFVLNVLCFVLQTTIFQHLKIGGVCVNLLVVVTASAGLMYGRKLGMFSGVVGGLLVDAMFHNVIGISILIYTVVGYVNGMANKLYFKEDLYIPILSVALSDLSYGVMYYVFQFMLRGRLDFPFYFLHIILPETVYTVLVGTFIYLLMRRIKEQFNPEEPVALQEHIEENQKNII